MRILLAAVAVLPGFLLPSVSHAEMPQFPFVHAEGEAEVETPPDKATIRFSVTTFHKESAVALETLQAQVRMALAALKRAEVPEDRITGFDLQKMVERSQDEHYNELEIIGYYLSRDFEAELTDLKKFSPLVADLMAIDNVTRVNADFDVKNRDDVESRLVEQAGQDARRRAEEMARSLGVSIESVFAISESPIGSVGQRFQVASNSYAVMRSVIAAPEAIFVPETIELRKSVDVIFKLREQ